MVLEKLLEGLKATPEGEDLQNKPHEAGMPKLGKKKKVLQWALGSLKSLGLIIFSKSEIIIYLTFRYRDGCVGDAFAGWEILFGTNY